MSKVSIDNSTCVGCGLCEQLCPEVFAVKDGIAQAKTSGCTTHDLSEIHEQCPVGAIKVS